MRLVRLVLLGLPITASLSACGHSAPMTPTLSVTCNGSLSLAGAASIDVASVAGGGTLMSFPDPANPGHTGTLPVTTGQPCTIAPVLNKAGSTDGNGTGHGSSG